MDGLRPLTDDATLPDVFVAGVPHQITTGLAYVLLKHHAACGADIELHPWDTWERLEGRVGERLGLHVWHPSHWDRHYETLVDVPASTPGAVPLTMAMVRERKREKHAQLALLALEEAG